MSALLFVPLLLAVAPLQSFDPIQVPDDPLRSLHRVHPRIMATAADFARLKETIRTDPLAGRMQTAILRQADSMLKKPMPQHVLPDGKRLLATSRDVKDRMQTLGLAWQLTGNSKYPEQAWKVMEAAGNFPDWNPPHFLDTAEMTRAFAVGLDWMYEAWTPAQREQICQWIIKQGIEPGMAAYTDRRNHNYTMVRVTHNWNQVCNGGIGTGALAIADLHPDEAREPLRHALECIQPSLACYAPDGGWNEGYGYYTFAMEYATGFLSSLEASLGTDFGLSKIPGFSLTPDFPTYIEGPCGSFFGYADCGEGEKKSSTIPYAGWVATRVGNTVAADSQRKKAGERPSALGLLWLPPLAEGTRTTNLARSKEFTMVGCCSLRTKWGDSDAGFVALKAGDNKANHSHLDIGTFMYDVGGQHWAVDLGADNYNLPDYFGSKRWDYYRLRAEGNNTIVVDPGKGPDQSPKADCPLTLCADRGNACVAVGDLSAAYPSLSSEKRGVRLANDGSLRIQDELDSGIKEVNVLWFMHTPATIAIASDGRSATLSQNGKTLRAELISPADARFESMAAAPLPTSPNPPNQLENHGITKLVARSVCKNKETLIIDFSPNGVLPSHTPVTPLSSW